MTRTRTLLIILLTVPGLLAGCSAVGGSSDSGGAGGGASRASAARPAAGQAEARSDSTADPLAAAGTRRVRAAEATIRVRDVRVAAGRIRTTAIALGGYVGTEQITDGGPSTLTARVPESRLDAALDAFAAAGTEKSRAMSSDDVSGTIADLNSRVATQEASVRRVRALLGRAQKLGDVVMLEGELTRRQADLEAAQARYRALDDRATLATATLTLMPKGRAATRTADDGGFRAGFAAGWKAVTASTAVLLTVLGALFPLAIVAAAIGLPVLAWRRRRPVATAHQPAQPAGQPVDASSVP